MKLLHISDLHLGKVVNHISMLEDQEYLFFGPILDIIRSEQPDGIIIAGDVYDSSTATKGAMDLMDRMLEKLAELRIPAFIISGNHDSETFVGFGESFFSLGGIHLSPQFSGKAKAVTMKDGYGEVTIYLLPYLTPALVRKHFPDKTIASFTDAVRTVVESLCIDTSKRNVLVAHQFVTGASRTESERVQVGGTDNVDASVFNGFDYVALGHIHRPQYIGRKPEEPGPGPVIRYSGSPLKYSFSEVNDVKSVTVVELGEKGKLSIHLDPLVPRTDMAELRGTFEELTKKSFYDGKPFKDQYLRITLTDDYDIANVRERLLKVYPKLMTIDFDNSRTRSSQVIEALDDIKRMSPIDLVEKFFELQTGSEMKEEQKAYSQKLLDQVFEEEA